MTEIADLSRLASYLLGGNMLEWKPRLVLLLVALAGFASILSLLRIAPANYGW